MAAIVREAVTFPTREVGLGTLAVGSAYLLVATYVSQAAFAATAPPAGSVEPLVSNPALARAVLVGSVAYLVVMAPVYGYLVRLVQRGLSPERPPSTWRLGRLTRVGLKFGVVASAFAFLPGTLIGLAVGPWAADALGVVAAVAGEGVAVALFGVVGLVVSAVLVPVVTVTFARRERLSDLLVFEEYRPVLADRRYARLVAAVLLVNLVAVVANLGLSALNAALYPPPDLVTPAAGPLTPVLTAVWAAVTFWSLVAVYHVIGHDWGRIHAHRRPGDESDDRRHARRRTGHRLAYDPTRTRRLDEFAGTARSPGPAAPAARRTPGGGPAADSLGAVAGRGGPDVGSDDRP